MAGRRIHLRAPSGVVIDTSAGLSVSYNGVTRVLPQAQLDAIPNTLPWLRGIVGFMPKPPGALVDVDIIGGVKQFYGRRTDQPLASGKDTPALHEAGSAWTQAIPANPTLAASFSGGTATGAMAAALDYWRYCITRTTAGIAAAARRWSVPVYFSDENTPTQDITGMMFGTASQDRFNDLPVPAGAAPDPAGDGHYCCIKPHSTNGTAHGEEFDGYNLLVNAGVFSVDGSGWCVCDPPRRGWIRGANGVGGGLGIRANQTSGLGGLIWPHEIAMGRIEHALAFSFPKQRAFFYPQSVASAVKSPANGSVTAASVPAGFNTRHANYNYTDASNSTLRNDSTSAIYQARTDDKTTTWDAATGVGSRVNDQEGLPGGQRVQLDPSIDLDAAATTYSWLPYEKVIARAAQEYGLIMVDGGGYSAQKPGLYLVNTQGWTTNPFTPIHADLAGNETPGMRWANDLRDSFRILDMGTPQPRSYHAYSIPNDGHNATAYTA